MQTHDYVIDADLPVTTASPAGGIYQSSQNIILSCTDNNACIATYYTTDGSAPGPDNPRAAIYTAPLRISTTTVLRAAASLEGLEPTDVDTQSYLFPADVAAQSATPENFPPA